MGTLTRMSTEQKLGILEAHARGILTDAEAMYKLGIENEREFFLLLNKTGARQPVTITEETENLSDRDGSLQDGYVHYWLSRNVELES